MLPLIALLLIGGPAPADRPVSGWVVDYAEDRSLTVYFWDDGLEDPDRPGLMKYHNGLRGRVVPYFKTKADAWGAADAQLQLRRDELLAELRRIEAERAEIAARVGKVVRP